MIFEKDVGEAISILKDICFVIPPYQIPGLSYVQEEEPDDLFSTLNEETQQNDEFDDALGISPNAQKKIAREHNKQFMKK